MPSKMSLFNKEIILQICRSAGWVSIVYFLGLLFILPIRLLMIYSDDQQLEYPKFETLFHFGFTYQLGLIVIVPVILAVFLFRFLHVKQASDLMHSLPVKRSRIFHHYALTGVVFLILPVAIITIMVFILHTTLDLGSFFRQSDILYWAGTTIMMTLLLYTASVFIAMMTGITAVQGVLAYVFVFFPVGIMLLLFYNLRIFLYGFPSNYLLSRDLDKMSPITFAAGLEGKIFHWNEAVIYSILSIALYLLALFFYKKRKLEAASEAIAFAKLRCVFKYGVAFCTMLLGGAYFNDLSNSSTGWTFFGYLVGAVFGYFVAEMVLQKTWRVFSHFKGLIVFVAASTIVLIIIQNLGIYENHLPKLNEIESVVLTKDPSIYLNHGDFDQGYSKPQPLTESKNIEAVLTLHDQFIADKKINQNKQRVNNEIFYLNYQLKNGHKIIREYKINERLYDHFLKPIYETKEYKLKTNEIFRLKENKIKTIIINTNTPGYKMVTLANPKEIHEALDALKKDVLAESYEDSVYFENRGSNLEAHLSKNQYSITQFKPNYQHFAQWLKEKNWLDQATVTADDISHVLVTKADISEKTDDISKEIEKSSDSVDITDHDQIEQLLKQASMKFQHEYKAVFYYEKAQYSEVLFFDEAHAPDFLKKDF